MESLVPLQGLGRVEGGQALWLPGPTGFGDLLVTEKSRVLKRPRTPLTLSRISWHLVAWWASLGAHPSGQDRKWISANNKAPTAFSELSEN